MNVPWTFLLLATAVSVKSYVPTSTASRFQVSSKSPVLWIGSYSAKTVSPILTPTIFKYLETQTRGAGNEIQLTDAILRMMAEESVYSMEVDGRRYDIGSKLGFITATLEFALKRDDLRDDVKALIESLK